MSAATNAWLRFSAAAVLLVLAAVYLEAHRKPEPAADRRPLSTFPFLLGNWMGRDYSLDPEVLRVLGAGDVLVRLYRQSGPVPPVDLFIAYFPSQRTGETIHSPQNCLPGTGWTPLEHTYRELSAPGGRKVMVNRYLIGKGLERDMVLYWYQSHGRVIPSEYWAKIYLVVDSIRTGRSDGSLVRVITPVVSSESVESAELRAAGFAESILPLLDNHIPKD